jgi:DNA-dependent metalloprotease WSS1
MSNTRSTELEPLVDQFEHLTSKRRANEALHILRRVASMVKPIMRVRGWRVGALKEFWPDEAGLLGLNVNRGQAIYLRLRYPGDDTQFLPFENVVDTMLHELSHIVHGPHNQAFHALWDKLRDEHEALLRKGYTGEGFLGKGNRVGGRGIPRAELQRQARAAAERRREHARIASGSGSRLGGQGILRGQDAREIIAAAAERRNRVNRGCGSAIPDMGRKIAEEQAIKKEQVSITKAENADEDEAALMQAYIEMIREEEAQLFGPGYVPPSHDNPTGGLQEGHTVQPPPDTRKLREEQLNIERRLKETPSAVTDSAAETSSRPTPPPARALHEEPTWTCDICTLVNPINHLMCGACETERPTWFNPPSPPPSASASDPRPKTKPSKAQHSHSVLASRTSAADNIARFESAARQKAQSKPMGWTCGHCSNWMEDQWWTCSVCGRMKEAS